MDIKIVKLYGDFYARKGGNFCFLRRLKEFGNTLEGIVVGQGQNGNIIFFRNFNQFRRRKLTIGKDGMHMNF